MEKKDRFYKTGLISCILFLSFFLLPSPALPAGPIDGVRVEPLDIDVSKKEMISITWKQYGESIMDVMICNLDGWVVRTLKKRARGKSGRQTVTWDGKDDSGMMCSNGVYVPIIKIWSKERGSGTYNPTAFNWGETVTAQDILYDSKGKKITYQLKKRALCLMHIGEHDGGPVYRTLFGYDVRNAGMNEESWDGLDNTGTVEVGKREKLRIMLDAFSLPVNAIHLKGSMNKGHINTKKSKKYPLHPPHGESVFLHALCKRKSCGDFTIGLEIVDPIKHGRVPVVSGTVTLKIPFIKGPDLAHFKRETFEAYAFMDGAFIVELPQEKLPAVLKIDTSKYTNGEHVLTVNLRTLEDHVGTYSKRIKIKN